MLGRGEMLGRGGGWKETRSLKRAYRHADSEIILYVVFGAEPAPSLT